MQRYLCVKVSVCSVCVEFACFHAISFVLDTSVIRLIHESLDILIEGLKDFAILSRSMDVGRDLLSGSGNYLDFAFCNGWIWSVSVSIITVSWRNWISLPDSPVIFHHD